MTTTQLRKAIVPLAGAAVVTLVLWVAGHRVVHTAPGPTADQVTFCQDLTIGPTGLTALTACAPAPLPTGSATACPNAFPDHCTMTEVAAACNGAAAPGIIGFEVITSLPGTTTAQTIPIAGGTANTPSFSGALLNTHAYFSNDSPIILLPHTVAQPTTVGAECRETIWFTTSASL